MSHNVFVIDAFNCHDNIFKKYNDGNTVRYSELLVKIYTENRKAYAFMIIS